MVDFLVTAVAAKDVKVLEVGMAGILKYIRPLRMLVVVPDNDYEIVDGLLSRYHCVTVSRDSEFVTKKESACVKAVLARRNQSAMYGWYVQQFIKIKAVAANHTEFSSDYVSLIWDADTIPIRPLNFVSRGRLQCFVSNEYHEPYFETIYNLLGMEKQTPYSFIAQCLPLYPHIARKIIDDLGGGGNWVENVMNGLSLESPCAFSEYEIIGTYMLSTMIVDIDFVHSAWLRGGRDYYYPLSSIDGVLGQMSSLYSYVAFEGISDSSSEYYVGRISRYIKRLFGLVVNISLKMLGLKMRGPS